MGKKRVTISKAVRQAEGPKGYGILRKAISTIRDKLLPDNNFTEITVREVDEKINNDLLAKRVVGLIPTDALRGGFKVDIPDNEELEKDVNELIKDYKIKNKLLKMYTEGFQYGDAGLLLLVGEEVQEGEEVDITEPPKNYSEIEDFTVYNRKRVSDLKKFDDLFSANYGKVETITLANKSGEGASDINTERFYHFQYNAMEDVKFGKSILEQLKDALNIETKVRTSVGNIAHRAALLHHKTNINQLENLRKNDSDVHKLTDRYSNETVIVTAPGDEIAAISVANGFSPKDYYDSAINILATQLGAPSTRIQGSQKGALASSEVDVEQYDDILKSFREMEIENAVRWVVDIFLKHLGRETEYEVVFGDLHDINEKEESEIRDKNSGSAKKYAEAMEIFKRNVSEENIDTITQLLQDKVKFEDIDFEALFRR